MASLFAFYRLIVRQVECLRGAIGTLAKGIMALAVLAIAATVAIVGAGVFAAFGLAAAPNVSPVVTGLSLATGALPVVGLCYYLIKNKL